MRNHIRFTISDVDLAYEIDQDSVQQEARLDGTCVIRTSVPQGALTVAGAVRAYKSLADVERAFCTSKSIVLPPVVDWTESPIHHRLVDRAKAHLFLCIRAFFSGGTWSAPGPATPAPTQTQERRYP